MPYTKLYVIVIVLGFYVFSIIIIIMLLQVRSFDTSLDDEIRGEAPISQIIGYPNGEFYKCVLFTCFAPPVLSMLPPV